jgi:hypothetical protein
MSWSLRIRNGDLVIDGAKLGQVAGPSKLVQDLRCALLEQKGNDNLHPEFGSLIDGGIDENGNIAPSIVGESNWDLIALRIQSEIHSVAKAHQQRQLQRAAQDRSVYGDSTLSANEILLSVTNIEMFHAQDTLLVRIHLSTGTSQVIKIDVPVAANSSSIVTH